MQNFALSRLIPPLDGTDFDIHFKQLSLYYASGNFIMQLPDLDALQAVPRGMIQKGLVVAAVVEPVPLMKEIFGIQKSRGTFAFQLGGVATRAS